MRLGLVSGTCMLWSQVLIVLSLLGCFRMNLYIASALCALINTILRGSLTAEKGSGVDLF